MGRGQRLNKGAGEGSLAHVQGKPPLLKQDKAHTTTAGHGSISGSGASCHDRISPQQAVILEEARKRACIGLSINPPVGFEGQRQVITSDSVTDSISVTLGEEDTLDGTPSARQKVSMANNSLNSVVPETEGSEDDSSLQKQDKGSQKATFASLFAGNRQISNGSNLDQRDFEDEDVFVEAEEVMIDWSPWQHSLVGYFGGRFPGRNALKQIVDSWKVHVSIHFHTSGWIIFKFDNEETQIQVLQGGPYMIFGRPLLLKLMPQFFKFENEELSTFPVWVQLRNLPLALWGTSVLSKICSRLGKPIATDKMTAHRERVSYARALVEVDVAKPIKHFVNIVLPNGDRMEQPVHYENLPRFCSHCKVVGHSLEDCKAQEKASEKFKQAVADRVKNARSVSGNAAVSGHKQPVAGPSKPVEATKENTHSVAVPNPVIAGPRNDDNLLAVQTNKPVVEADAQVSCPISEQNRVSELLAIDVNQLSAEQMLERGKSKVQEVHSGDLAEPVINSSSTAGKKKTKKKDRRKEIGQNIAAFCADMGGDSPNICPK